MKILIDYGILVPFVLSLFFWTRALWKENKGDIIFSVFVLLASILLYLRGPALSPVFGLPWMFLLLFAVSACIVGLTRRVQRQSKRVPAIAVVICVVLSVLCFVSEKQWVTPSNSILVLEPYRYAGTWVFDDPRVGLKGEPFVSGIPELIDKIVADIPNAEKGFRLLFSAQPFPGYKTKVVWKRREVGGSWYYSEEYDMEGWLCPALFKYFKRAPREIYIKAEPIQN